MSSASNYSAALLLTTDPPLTQLYRNHIVQVALSAFPQGLKGEWLSLEQLVKKKVEMKINGLLHFGSFCVNAVHVRGNIRQSNQFLPFHGKY